MAKADHPYHIELARLKPGRHQFDFNLDDALLESPDSPTADSEPAPLSNVAVSVALTLDKSDRLIDVGVRLTGSITLSCDRCLLDYPFAIDTTYRIVFSHDRSVAAADAEADVRYLPAGVPVLDLRQEFYEALLLQVPQRRIPSDCPGPRCPPEVLALLAAGERAAEGPLPEDADPDQGPIDPRWSALRGLKPN